MFQQDDENENKQERISSRVNQAVEERCKFAKFEPTLTEKEGRYCDEAVSHYLSGNIRGGSKNFAPSKLEIFVTNDSWLPDTSNITKSSMLC